MVQETIFLENAFDTFYCDSMLRKFKHAISAELEFDVEEWKLLQVPKEYPASSGPSGGIICTWNGIEFIRHISSHKPTFALTDNKWVEHMFKKKFLEEMGCV